MIGCRVVMAILSSQAQGTSSASTSTLSSSLISSSRSMTSLSLKVTTLQSPSSWLREKELKFFQCGIQCLSKWQENACRILNLCSRSFIFSTRSPSQQIKLLAGRREEQLLETQCWKLRMTVDHRLWEVLLPRKWPPERLMSTAADEAPRAQAPSLARSASASKSVKQSSSATQSELLLLLARGKRV